MKFLNTPFLLLLLALISGIVISTHLPFSENTIYRCALISLLIFIVCHYLTNRQLVPTSCFTAATFFVFSSIGASLVKVHDPALKQDHYTSIATNLHTITKDTLVITIEENLKSSAYYHTYIAHVAQLNQHRVQGKILLKIKSDSCRTDTKKVRGRFLLLSKLQPIKLPKNPNQFNYAHYLEKKYVYAQATLQSQNALISIPEHTFYFKNWLQNYREKLLQQLMRFDFSPAILNVSQALLLGKRDTLSKSILSNYQESGALHILALSGLHIGILTLLLKWLLRPLIHLPKGRTLQSVAIILLLWLFALLTGLSPSILRAVTMFSFIIIGSYANTQKSIFNSLITSAFIILCVEPLSLFHPGFQLSYIAVLGILLFQPGLARLWLPKYYFFRKFWEITTVSIAVQIAVTPLALFYFHQFPGLFLLSNYLIIPMLGLVLILGFSLLFVCSIGFSNEIIAHSFGLGIHTMNLITEWIASKHTFFFDAIPMSFNGVVVSYLFISSTALFIQFRTKKTLWVTVLVSGMFVFLIIQENNNALQQTKFVVFHQFGQPILGLHKQKTLELFSTKKISATTQKYLINPYTVATRSNAILKTTFVDTLTFNGRKIQVVSSRKQALNKIKNQCDLLILCNSPKINLDRVLQDKCPKKVVADGSNYPSDLRRWQKSCEAFGIPFYRTDSSGAFMLE